VHGFVWRSVKVMIGAWDGRCPAYQQNPNTRFTSQTFTLTLNRTLTLNLTLNRTGTLTLTMT
jgi:hypothetical protein